MTRLNLILFFALMFSALGLVNSQHKSRNLYIELERTNQAAKRIEQEYGQLQLEQSTWAMHSRIEKIAATQMQMQVPDAKRVQVISLSQVPTVQLEPMQMAPINVQPSQKIDGQVNQQNGVAQ
ncbi:cell division protein FtsL [Methylotenera sp.]|uniref:cell division protein FtsL n=1 Tax=Methylotenera sp. TaxID=2051956 RepID=UPI002731271D|nr:cell division protein FtsL [Methylotenera sp.]MDP2231414.1 cell division protein FtsL [Methylotenera sp.]MDP3140482.1 cell division protein FtsL [Methylotenera sp.]MDP3307312.1 cell division protein FtsL [Methylotenera sp.]